MGLASLLIFAAFLVGGAFAFRIGGPPERLAAVAIVGWIGADAAYHLLFGPSDFARVDPVHLVLDAAELAVIVAIALRADRLWPLVAAAAQLICMAGHAAQLLEPGPMRRAYWAVTQLPQYLQLAALVWGAAAHRRRERRTGRAERAWRAGPSRAVTRSAPAPRAEGRARRRA